VQCVSRNHQSIYRTKNFNPIITYSVSVDAADEANISHVKVDGLLEITQLGESINNNTEQNVNHDDDDQNMEGAVKHKFDKEHLTVVICNRKCGITDTTTRAETDISHFNEALEHCCAEIFVRNIFKLVNVEIDICILQIKEPNFSVDENNCKQEQGSH
jgi:hypothetical protein